MGGAIKAVTSIFSGVSTPSPPPPAPPPPAPAAPDNTAAATARDAAAREEMLRRMAAGRASTIKTGATGDMSEATVATKQLLGS